MKILIIEDERELSDNIVTFLSSENYLCEQAFTFADAKMKVHLYEYECIVLDIMLPDGNGLELLKEIRDRHSQVGVIIVSAKDSINDKILNSATHIVRNKFKILSNNILPSILPCQKIHLT